MQVELSARDQRRRALKSFVALLLTFAAGYVDIVGLLTVYKMFTAHMTGTTVHLAEQIVRKNWRAALIAATIVAAFVVGSIWGRILIEIAARKKFRRIASITFLLELLLLFVAAVWGNEALSSLRLGQVWLICSILSLFAAAMGLQTATLTRIGPLTIHTTFVTGMLNKLAQLISKWIFLSIDINRAPADFRAKLVMERETVSSRSRLIFAIWMCYLLGAVCGTWVGLRSQLRALYLPCAMLLVAIAADQLLPLSVEEERQQESQ